MPIATDVDVGLGVKIPYPSLEPMAALLATRR